VYSCRAAHEHGSNLLTNQQCRSRHLKCGAETPICSRCIQDGKVCLYTKSRRGMKNKKDQRPNPPFSTGRKESHISRSQTIRGRDIYRQFSSLSTGLPSNKPRYMTADPATSFLRTTEDQRTLDQTTLLELYYEYVYFLLVNQNMRLCPVISSGIPAFKALPYKKRVTDILHGQTIEMTSL
jgi:hypothetical protein